MDEDDRRRSEWTKRANRDVDRLSTEAEVYASRGLGCLGGCLKQGCMLYLAYFVACCVIGLPMLILSDLGAPWWVWVGVGLGMLYLIDRWATKRG